MPRRATTTEAARTVLGRLPRPVRRPAARAASALRVRRAPAGQASLVVLCEPVDLTRLPETLAAVLAEAPREVLVVPVGAEAAEAVHGAVERAGDARLRELPAQPTWVDAANTGLEAARGRYLQLLRACDPRVPGALAALAEALAASGSDLATGGVVQRGRPAAWLRRASETAHARPARGVLPAERPELAGDLGWGDKLLLASTWRDSGRRLGPDDAWLLSPTLAAHLADAARVDVLGRPVQEHLGGHGVRAFGAAPNHLRDLQAWTERAAAVERALDGTALAAGWRQHVLDAALPGFLRDTERATDEQWGLLRRIEAGCTSGAGVGEEAAHPDPEHVRAESRILTWLCARDQRADVEHLSAVLDGLEPDVPTVVGSSGEVLADWPGLPADIPAEVRRLGEAETPLVAAVVRVVGSGAGRRLDLHVRVDQVDLPDTGVELTAAVADGPSVGQELDVEVGPDAAATRWAGHRFARALGARLRVPEGTRTVRLTLRLGELVRTGELAVTDPRRRHPDPHQDVLVRGLRLEGEDLVVDGAGGGALTLVDADDRPIGVATDAQPRIRLRQQHFGQPRRLPTGHYRLVVDGRPPRLAEELVDRLPCEQVGVHHRLRTMLGPAGGLLLHLGPALSDDELGRYAQTRLVAAYTEDQRRPDPDVFYFESYVGRSATDSPRDIHTELLRRRPAATTYWGVADASVEVPPGARRVLLRSREWYDVLARAGCLVVNTDVEEWFGRRAGQFLLQTFHGYPSKGMGLGQWRAADLPESRIRVLRARGVDTWSAILTPTPEMTRHYREQYAYTGPAFDRGYPRDDALVGPDADARRRRTRELLGLRPDQVAVLYAPTWRENLATRARRAALTTHLDVEAAARALGERHVLLLRGHRFHHDRDASPGVVDVTEHPEINDLVLASDVAVLDYSSLRFDYAVTGKPMVFLVPDLEEYDAGSRRFLFPFEDSAPGPLVSTTAEVVERVRDLSALREDYAAAIEDFNRSYNRWHDGHAAERVVDSLLAALAREAADPAEGAAPGS